MSSRGRIGLLLLAFVAFLAMPLGVAGLRSLQPVSVVTNPRAHPLPAVHNQHSDSAAPLPKVSSVLTLAVVLVLLLGFVVLAQAGSAVPELEVVGGARSRAPPLVA